MARRRTLVLILSVAAVVVAVAAGFGINEVLARRHLAARVHALTGGDAHAGRIAMARRPCGSCHTIPNVSGARGKVGPPLTAFASRVYIAGRANNNPDNLVRWLMNPQSIDPETAMPPTGLSEHEARDMAAYLYTLE